MPVNANSHPYLPWCSYWLRSHIIDRVPLRARDILEFDGHPEWFPTHSNGMQPVPAVFVVDNQLILHPSLGELNRHPASGNKLNSMGEPAS